MGGKAMRGSRLRATSIALRSSAAGTNKLTKSCRACITSPLCLSGGCSVRSRVVFNNSISITTLMNSRFASTAAAHVPADYSFTVSPSRPLPLIRHPTVPLFTAHRRYGGEGDTHLDQNGAGQLIVRHRQFTAPSRIHAEVQVHQ